MLSGVHADSLVDAESFHSPNLSPALLISAHQYECVSLLHPMLLQVCHLPHRHLRQSYPCGAYLYPSRILRTTLRERLHHRRVDNAFARGGRHAAGLTTTIGTLFASNSNGTFFVESLNDTNCNEMGYADYENLYGIKGVGLVNIVANVEEVGGRRTQKQLQMCITFDDGCSW
ncbi:hypothetical protein FOMPIDRAFT_1050062, partial [Fomitopsis schrenkii]